MKAVSSSSNGAPVDGDDAFATVAASPQPVKAVSDWNGVPEKADIPPPSSHMITITQQRTGS